MLYRELYKLKQSNNFKDFYKKIEEFIPSLKKYTVAKLIMAEKNGLLEKGFYTADDILDDVYLNLFNLIHSDMNEQKVRRLLFDKIEQKITQKTILEHQSFENVRIEDILKKEMDLLDEPYSQDGDGDLMPVEELDDISYKHRQDAMNETNFLIDQSIESDLQEKFEAEDLSPDNIDEKSLMAELMFSTPPLSQAVIELHVFGEQTNTQISEILMIDESVVTTIMSRAKARYRAILD